MVAGLAFMVFGVIFVAYDLYGAGFEVGVDSLGGTTPDELDPAVTSYISHLHVVIGALMVSNGAAVASMAWFGVRRGQRWAWWTILAVTVTGMAIALPMHHMGGFEQDWLLHLGPIYLLGVLFFAGGVVSGWALRDGPPPGA